MGLPSPSICKSLVGSSSIGMSLLDDDPPFPVFAIAVAVSIASMSCLKSSSSH